MNYALIFAGGVGSRMGINSVPKQFLPLAGRPIIINTIEKFDNHSDIDAIIVVCVESWIVQFYNMLDESAIKKVKWVVPGGKTGQESIYLGLKKLFAQCECPRRAVVLIHDGVRPMITPQLITENIESVRMHGSAITVAPAIETIVQTHQDGSVVGVIDRNDAFLARAPQSFFLQDLMDAHNKAIENHNLNEVDTTCLMRRYGYPLHTVPGPAENIKITTLTDYYMAKAIYERDELR